MLGAYKGLKQGYIEYSKEFTPLDKEKVVKTLLEVINNPEMPGEVKKEATKLLQRMLFGDFLDEQRLNELDRIIESEDDFEEKLRKEGLL